MVYGYGNQLIKFLLFISNLLIFLLGIVLFGFSLWANLDQNFSKHLHDFARQAKIDEHFVDRIAEFQASVWIFVGIGALLLVVGFLGCCGAACENLPLLALYEIVVLILALLEVFVLVFLFTNRAGLFESIHNALVQSAQTADGRRNLKPIQSILKCCGATIETKAQYRQEGLCPGELAKTIDCYSLISNAIDMMDNVLLFCGILLLIVQFLAIIFSSVICRALSSRRPAYYA